MANIHILISSGPTDIFRHVLEMAALSDRQTALNLIYTSKQLKSWIEPLIYRYISLRDDTKTMKFLACLLQRPDGIQFFGRVVESLSMRELRDDFLDTFHNATLERLHSFGHYLVDDSENSQKVLNVLHRAPNLRRLVMSLGEQVDVPYMSQALSATAITHLSVYSIISRRIFEIASCMPNLTHLSVDWDDEADLHPHGKDHAGIQSLCPELFQNPCPQWQVIVIIVAGFIPREVFATCIWPLADKMEKDGRFIWAARMPELRMFPHKVTSYVAGSPCAGRLCIESVDKDGQIRMESMWDMAEQIVEERGLPS